MYKDGANATIIEQKFIFARKRLAIKEGMKGFKNADDFNIDIKNVHISGESSV